MSDPWAHIVKAIEPEIDKLTRIMAQGSVIKPVLTRNNKGAWAITITRDSYDQYYIDNDIENFNNRIEWAITELENWDCWRSSYDTWIFASKDEAEKFMTYYILKWASA